MSTGIVVAIAFVGLAAMTFAVTGLTRRCRERRLLSLVERVTRRHGRLLAVKRNQLVVHDGYGNYHLEGWIRHVDYFIDNVILREARAAGHLTSGTEEGTRLRRAMTRRFLDVLREIDGSTASIPDAEILSGQHYETLCRNLLEEADWIVSSTPMTGDQGADLVADREGVRLVIQCKFYNRPVGNKAVQEAFAALGFHAGDRAVVVSNQGFTRAAEELARANGVLLIHHDQLRDLDGRRLVA